MKILLLAVTFLTLVAMFAQSYTKLQNDAGVVGPNLSFNEWLRHTAVEIVLNLLLFIAVCLGINIGLAEKISHVATSDEISAFSVAFSGAVATGTLIYKTVQLTFLPLWNSLTGAVTARKLLRDKISADR